MSGLLGLWRLDGAPVDPALLRRMADHMARRGPDGIRAEASGSLGMGFLEFRTLPGEAAPQPLMDDAMGCRLVFDGRLDNRDALKTSLEISGANPRETDLELIASAYRASPEDFPNALIGDFALALHDRQNNRLIAARDWLGQRPFYYFFAPGRLCAWSSEIAPLLELPEVSREPDEAALGEWLAACQMDASRTPFRDIQRLPPGHRLIVEPPASLRIEDWRRFEPKRELHFASDDEAAEAFREVFREAVACRLRAEGPVAIQASGGLDSSSVAAMARQIAPEARLETFAAVYPGVSACDESAQGRAVAEWLGLPRREVVQEPAPLAAYIDEVREFLDLPPFPNDFFASPLFPAMRESGARVCLTGLWGDHWLGASRGHWADLLRSGRWGDLWRQGRLEYPQASAAGLLWRVWRRGAEPILRRAAPMGARRAGRLIRRAAGGNDGIPPWMEPSFAKRIHLADRLRRDPAAGHRFESFARAEVFRQAVDSSSARVAELAERGAARQGVEIRHPFGDRRLFEFCLALPESQRQRNGWEKIILRNAMRGLLPESVRLRRGKAEFSHLLARTLASSEADRALARLDAAARGWVKFSEVERLREETAMASPSDSIRQIKALWTLWSVLSAEVWLREANGASP